MTTFMLASGKANAFVGLKKAIGTQALNETTRQYGSATAAAARNTKPAPRLTDDPKDSRELFVDILNANATKRDAKQYLSRFKTPKAAPQKPTLQEERNARHRRDQDRVDRMGVNLGGLYAPASAIAQTPQFTRTESQDNTVAVTRPELHVALVSLRSPESLDDEILDGLARTLSQLVKLDMRIVLALDCTDLGDVHFQDLHGRRAVLAQQGERLVQAIARHSPEGARLVMDAMSCSNTPDAKGDTGVNVGMPKLLLNPIRRGMVTIVPTLAYSDTGHLTSTSLAEIMRALAAQLTGQGHHSLAGSDNAYSDSISLDRIILLDPAGGIPSKNRGDGAHVFINLDEEFDGITKELTSGMQPGNTNSMTPSTYRQHLANLDMSRQCLAMLPSASSALIITPEEAAISSRSKINKELNSTGTRQQKNTLIHNLLTNKPLVSSSLPLARLPTNGHSQTTSSPPSQPTATLLKKGMPVTIIPSANRSSGGWLPPPSGHSALDLQTDPRIDFPRLVALIEDSFRRRLDVEHYLSRIRGRTAGLIIAGDYEGGAILTWEQSPHSTNPAHLVPYLDKFAVLQSSQGSAGVADIVFQAMVRTCFPKGVCWRSRNDNPVNKWYFERAEGTWTIPDSNWTMFWTGSGVVEEREKWDEYVGVCRSVVPSWADGKRPD